MEVFTERPASAKSLVQRRKVYGVGVNDADYVAAYKGVDGKMLTCPYYSRWKSMLRRVYLEDKRSRPTYSGCSVHKDWHSFMTFKSWMQVQDWEGKQLDKDLLTYGNKVYSSETCIFVTSGTNNSLLDSASIRGEYPQGVTWCRDSNKYKAQCQHKRKSINIGRFTCINTAEAAYCSFKSDTLVRVAYEEEASSFPKLQEALLRHAKRFKDRADELRRKL